MVPESSEPMMTWLVGARFPAAVTMSELRGLFQGGEAFGGAAAGDQRVLGFRQGGEDHGAVVVHGLLLDGGRGFDARADAAGVEDRRGQTGGEVRGGGFRIEQIAGADRVSPSDPDRLSDG